MVQEIEKNSSNENYLQIYLDELFDRMDIGKVEENGKISYYRLARLLTSIEFYCVIDRDTNRVFDAYSFREKWWNENIKPYNSLPMDETNMSSSVSLFEVLSALSIRMENEILQSPESGNRENKWFWMIMKNIGWDKYTDDSMDDSDVNKIKMDAFRIMDRSYSENGAGGLFPLAKTTRDQTKVEIWYQMAEYIEENNIT